MNPKLAVCLAAGMSVWPMGGSSAAPGSDSSTSQLKYTIRPRVICSSLVSKPAAAAVLDVSTNTSAMGTVVVNPLSCKVKEDAYLTFHSTGKVDKAAIFFVQSNTSTACKEPELGDSPTHDGAQILEAKVYNGFVQPIEIKIGNVEAGEYYYCVDLGVEPMPNPAIIIKE